MGSFERRTKKGVLVSSFGIAVNLLLSAGKIAVGYLFGLVSVMADGFNNLSDCGSGVVSLVSFYISEKPVRTSQSGISCRNGNGIFDPVFGDRDGAGIH